MLPILESAEKMLKMNTNKPMFGLVVLEIACNIFINKTYLLISTLKPVASVETNNMFHPIASLLMLSKMTTPLDSPSK